MKGTGVRATLLLTLMAITVLAATAVNGASESDNSKIRNGVYVEDINISGMTKNEANDAIKKYVNTLKNTKVNIGINGETASTTLGDLGLKWHNVNVVDDALGIGLRGNAIHRYVERLDVENKGIKYNIDVAIGEKQLENSLESVCADYNVKAENASLKLTSGVFEVEPGKEGVAIDSKKTAANIYKYITEEWDRATDINIEAVTTVTEPEYTAEELGKIDSTPMGSYTTTFTVGYGYENRNGNIENGARLLDGYTIFPGEQFSLNEHLAPWTEENGYFPAGTYVDGGVTDSIGGGICQVSSTLYNALLRAEIEIVERYPHSMSVGYVPLAADAALAGDYKDLVFRNNTESPIYIQAVYLDGSITFNVYGNDTRPDNRTIEYTSETISTTPIETEYEEDDTLPTDYEETVSNGHTGYVAKLWKHIYIDGEETDVELVNTSTYKMSPTKVVKGTKEEETTTEKKDKKKKDSDGEKTTEKSEDETGEEVVTTAAENADED